MPAQWKALYFSMLCVFHVSTWSVVLCRGMYTKWCLNIHLQNCGWKVVIVMESSDRSRIEGWKLSHLRFNDFSLQSSTMKSEFSDAEIFWISIRRRDLFLFYFPLLRREFLPFQFQFNFKFQLIFKNATLRSS